MRDKIETGINKARAKAIKNIHIELVMVDANIEAAKEEKRIKRLKEYREELIALAEKFHSITEEEIK